MNDFLTPVFLRNTHIQSILSSLKFRLPLIYHRAKDLLNHAVSYILDCGGGVRLQGWYSPHSDEMRNLVILIHGWEGSANSSYILSAASHLWQHGFDIFRLNLRDHGDTHYLNPELFHSCRIDEVVGAIKRIQELFPQKQMFLGGFSLGGNFALRVAVRAENAGINLAKAVAVCPVLNPEKTMKVLDTGWFAYRRYFLKKWKRSLKKKREYFPHLQGLNHLSRFKTLTEMTDYFVRYHTDFDSVKQYLNGYAVIGNVLENLNIPTYIIASADDPVIPADDLTRLAASEYLNINEIKYGGHCGFIENYRLTSWADQKMAEIYKKTQSAEPNLQGFF